MTTVPPFAGIEAPANWRTVDFISDLHLAPDEPGTFKAWQHYMLNTSADAVFILGDLFEVWVGDDSASPGSFEEHCGQVLRACGAMRDVFFMCGNRDFLVGADFLARHRTRPLADPAVLRFDGHGYLLTHGDALCTSDLPYQQFRQLVRSTAWQASFMARALPERQAMARQMRAHSQAHHGAHPAPAQVDAASARRWLAAADATTLIHGHTHQPANHALGHDGQGRVLKQVVLSDWHVGGGAHRAEVLRLAEGEGLLRIPPAGLR